MEITERAERPHPEQPLAGECRRHERLPAVGGAEGETRRTGLDRRQHLDPGDVS